MKLHKSGIHPPDPRFQSGSAPVTLPDQFLNVHQSGSAFVALPKYSMNLHQSEPGEASCEGLYHSISAMTTRKESWFTLPPSKTDIYNGRLKTQDLRCRKLSFIYNSLSCVLSLVSCVLSLINSDYFHYLAWIAESFNTNVLQHFHQKKMITSITYTLQIHYHIHYLAQKSRTIENPENCDYILKTENRKLKTKFPWLLK